MAWANKAAEDCLCVIFWILSGILSRILSWILSWILLRIPSWILSWIPSWLLQVYAARFGREVLGPAVCGFTLWLLDRIRSDRTEKIFFLGRDGWLLLQAYRLLAGPEDPPAFYLQVSRRSLRVPLYSRPMSYEEAVSRAGFPVSVTLACFLDGLGMDPAACGPLADRYGIGAEEQISRDRLYKDPRFRGLYEELADRIRRAALQERQSLRAYLKQFNFRGSWAVADIGWGGTLQRDLWELLGDIPGLCPPAGCYLGLSSRADAVLGPAGLSAAGYLFDSRRESGRSPVFREPQRLYVGLLETLLAEQTGSVRDYISDGRGSAVPRRYPFEGGKGRGPAADAQAAALAQIRDYRTGSETPPPDALSGRALVRAAMYPSGRMVRAFGSCLFLDSGSTAPLARPAGRLHYLFHPRALVRDFRASRWKAGFLRALLGFPAPCTLLLAAAEWAETAGDRCRSAAGTACLLAGLARNDIRSRFSGSFLGLLWAFLLPLITILVFWYVFQRGFRNPDVGGAPYILWFTAGYVQWIFLTDILTTGTPVYTDCACLVKQIPFRIRLLPLVRTLSACLVHLFFLFFLIFMAWICRCPFSAAWCGLLYYSVCTAVLGWAFVRILSVFHVFFRDTAAAVSILVQIGFWITPILWNENTLTDVHVRQILRLNPVRYIVQGCRQALLEGTSFLEAPREALGFWAGTALLCLAGRLICNRLMPYLADEL